MDDLQRRYQEWIDAGYDPKRAFDLVYEEDYYLKYGHLPDDHYVIERVEIVCECYLFIHSDPDPYTYS